MFKNLLAVFILSFISVSLKGQAQFQNPGFEEWEEVGTPYEEPVNWSSLKTSDNEFANDNAPRVLFRSDTLAHSGDYSVYLINEFVTIINHVATGTFTNGRIHVHPLLKPDSSSVITVVGDERWHTQFNQRPDSVSGWFLCSPQGDDFPTVKVILHQDSASSPGTEDEWIAMAYWEGPNTEVDTWTRFSVPFEYYNDETPEFVLSVITSGNGTEAVTGSEAWFDDIELVYVTGIDEISADDFHVFYANGELNVKLYESNPEIYQLQVFNLLGRPVLSQQIKSGSNSRIPLSVPTGVYIVSVVESGKSISKKVFVQ